MKSILKKVAGVVLVAVILNAFGATLSTFCTLYVVDLNEFFPSKYLATIVIFSFTCICVLVPSTFTQFSSSRLYCFCNSVFPYSIVTVIGPVAIPFLVPILSVFLDVVGSDVICITFSVPSIFTIAFLLVLLPWSVIAFILYVPFSSTSNISSTFNSL